MSSGNGRPGPSAAPVRSALLRLRLKKGDVHVIRTLSETYKGLLGHWTKGQTEYCPGKDLCPIHGIKIVWKGYCCVEVWNQAGNLWVPWVLEVTESLDQDFWGVYKRGQVWEVRYAKKREDSKGFAVTGTFWEQCDPHSFPEPYDMAPVILGTYRSPFRVQVNLDNPMPRRLVVPASVGGAPRRPSSQEADTPVTVVQMQNLRELRKRLNNGTLTEK